MPPRTDFLRQPPVAIVVTTSSLGIVATVDYLTGPRLNLSVAYFIPIIFAAWALGRTWAFITALAAEVPTYADQAYLARAGEISVLAATSNTLVRLLIFSSVAEIAWRLVTSREQIRQTADDLRRLSERLQAAYERLEEDVKTAGLLQSSVLSFTPPSLPGIEVGASIEYAGPTGGDFADARIADDRVYACVADVSGKGVPAALFTILLKHLLVEARDLGLGPTDVVASLNRSLHRILPSDYFVTLFYAEITPSTGHVRYVNAGHPEGLICRAETGHIKLAGPTTPLLGPFEDLSIALSRLWLRPGDVLTLYTDGVTDSKTPEGWRLGEDAIRRLVRQYRHLDAQKMADSIRAGIEAATDESTRDDLTIICVKATELP